MTPSVIRSVHHHALLYALNSSRSSFTEQVINLYASTSSALHKRILGQLLHIQCYFVWLTSRNCILRASGMKMNLLRSTHRELAGQFFKVLFL